MTSTGLVLRVSLGTTTPARKKSFPMRASANADSLIAFIQALEIAGLTAKK
jgi:hypothetical protein